MKIIGLTGGIGSGKTTVANMFRELGVPVYVADLEAKNLMNTSKVIKRQLIEKFGDQAYSNGELNRNFLAAKVFNDEVELKKINNIVHPKVKEHFEKWLTKQTSPYIIKEAAIIFEHNRQHEYDAIILVVSDKQKRLERVMKRDNSTREKVISIMNNQMADDVKIPLSDYIIENTTIEDTKIQVEKLHQKLLES
ncbi:dephospho-CoA kinase [Aegicerativicinus sediminis]|uniref:dephospho-CoA kinase n=1 Tax=Aegicerativicinus sediminis TaxID=2893202 RepID=UPI001E464073|nr:dephospho-CoA kinase [Aegicerativicinus sediminis]